MTIEYEDHNTKVWANKYGWGLRINTTIGWWASLGLHLDFKHKHIDLHLLWWVFIIGNTNEPMRCGLCDTELDEDEMFLCLNCPLPPFENRWVSDAL